MTRLVALYPRSWRDRYEAEFRALMTERPPTLGDRLDVVRGALDARLQPQLGSTSPGDPAHSHSARLGGMLAVLGGLLWAVAGIAFKGAFYNSRLGYKESDSAIAIAVAGALLTGVAALAMSRSLPRRRVLLSISATAVLLGALAMPLPWPIVFLGFFTTIIGTVMFGILAATRLGLTGIFLAGAGVLALGFNTEDDRALLLIPLGAAWVVLGIAAVRDRHAGDGRLVAHIDNSGS